MGTLRTFPPVSCRVWDDSYKNSDYPTFEYRRIVGIPNFPPKSAASLAGWSDHYMPHPALTYYSIFTPSNNGTKL